MKNINDLESIWSEISTDFVDKGLIYVDGYTTEDLDENGSVIATINIFTKEVIYKDERTKNNKFAQECINDVLKTL